MRQNDVVDEVLASRTRIQELLEANNRYLERARVAEARVFELTTIMQGMEDEYENLVAQIDKLTQVHKWWW